MDFYPFEEDSCLICPCCKLEIRQKGNGFHRHLMMCVKSTMTEPDPQGLAPKIQGMLEMITRLPLRSRISIMESLYRLSRTTGVKRNDILSPKVGASDKQVLNLLYNQHSRKRRGRSRTHPTGTAVNKRARRTYSQSPNAYSFCPVGLDLTAEISDSTCSPSHSPTSTPSISPFEKDQDINSAFEILAAARQNINENMVRRIISQIEPTYKPRA
mmetsp:Transcript_14969/g.26919  ORF Transcript_14969/g.26919 Transcript_14969/m.26919 type:complete len:214 (+) Transcript_14969:45-686(+)